MSLRFPLRIAYLFLKRLNWIFCMKSEDLIWFFYIHPLLIQFDARNEYRAFPLIMLSITRFTKTLWKVNGLFSFTWQLIKFHPVKERYTLVLVCSVVTMAFLCPNVGECPRVCFSLISVVLVVVYQPGKWLWWCQLTPHCHSRFVSQTHHLSHPLSHPSLSLTSCYRSPLPPWTPPHPTTFFLILWCFQFISTVLLLFLLDSISTSMMMKNGSH